MKRSCVGLPVLQFSWLVCASALAVSACDQQPGAAPTQVAQTEPAAPTPQPPQAAPAVALGPVHKLVVKDLDGNDVSLAKFAGRPMIIEIWATWCGPCRVNRANVQSLQSTMPERVLVIGVSEDTGASLVKNFLKNNHSNDVELMATPAFREFIRSINPSPSIPKTLYVDSKGRVADLAEGVQSTQWLAAMAKNLK